MPYIWEVKICSQKDEFSYGKKNLRVRTRKERKSILGGKTVCAKGEAEREGANENKSLQIDVEVQTGYTVGP